MGFSKDDKQAMKRVSPCELIIDLGISQVAESFTISS